MKEASGSCGEFLNARRQRKMQFLIRLYGGINDCNDAFVALSRHFRNDGNFIPGEIFFSFF